jgi:hypothetical protein
MGLMMAKKQAEEKHRKMLLGMSFNGLLLENPI